MNNFRLLRNILIIIFLTNIPAALSLPVFFKESVGWILGSVGSAINLIWLARDVKKNIDVQAGKAKLNAFKGYYIRYLFLLVYSSAMILFIKPEVLYFGLGLLSAQIAIYLHEMWRWIRRNKYYRE